MNFRTESEKNQPCNGFTLVEMLVAVAAASIVSLAALQAYTQYYRLTVRLYDWYQKETAGFLDEIRRLNPYVSGASRER
ncbi:type II secretion system protein J [uncultured Fibrobacter sp.]|uniref:PulJ/GspJ family protein n=1 Tax=uncultured Fibrobacter sp. TaxID=261512 RepID=UPI00260E8D32|nr:prepilin-type N-terminal cleavage/methylation domain-containing protein [uncultured Fibrobacter sp.]